ncbi:MAG: hypothetical protein DDT19_02783 [Syntrophomonadaceae bacterium]|nr:hypothetical protein [Bacillota bacterium]
MRIGLIVIGAILLIVGVYLFMGLSYELARIGAILGVIGFICTIVGAASGRRR